MALNHHKFCSYLVIFTFIFINNEKASADTIPSYVTERKEYIAYALKQPVPVVCLIKNFTIYQQKARDILLQNTQLTTTFFDEKTHQPFHIEIFSISLARASDLPKPTETTPSVNTTIYRIELYNFAKNRTIIGFVDIYTSKILDIQQFEATQPDLPPHLTHLALQIACDAPEVAAALGFKPTPNEALMAGTKTALNRTRCERSHHLCVAPTFVQNDKALWAIIDLTDNRLVGTRWTFTGAKQPIPTEKRLQNDIVTQCICEKINHIERDDWQFDYMLTSSDGLRISDVYYKHKRIISSAKLVDWHVSYSKSEGFGYSDAVGCPTFSTAAVVAFDTPRVATLIQNDENQGFTLEQIFSSEQWPLPCNYNYLQRFEFYKDGRFRLAAASLGRGCGNDGWYRPVFRIDLAGEQKSVAEAKNTEGGQKINPTTKTTWENWQTENWRLQDERTVYSKEGYQLKISNSTGKGFYIEPNRGQFKDNSRGDNAFLYITKHNAKEGDADLPTIGPCCNTNFEQGPEKFINNENLENQALTVWYVPQLKNDDTIGREYCWAKGYLENGIYKTHIYPCLAGAMFVPIK